MPLDVHSISDPEKLRTLMANARRHGREDIYNEAFRRLCALLPVPPHEDEPSILREKFWRAVHAAEEIRSETNRRTTKLSRTRQKYARDGVIATMVSCVGRSNPTEGFKILIDGGLPELTFEYIVIEHADHFDAAAVEASQARLMEFGITPPQPTQSDKASR